MVAKLAEAIFEVCGYAGVVFSVFLDYIKVLHPLFSIRASLAAKLLGTSSHRFSTRGVWGYTSPNSPSRARTYNLAVNSRSLYQLSYRGKQ